MDEWLVTEVKEVAGSLDPLMKLTRWLDEMADKGWSLVHVDNGVLYLRRKKDQ